MSNQDYENRLKSWRWQNFIASGFLLRILLKISIDSSSNIFNRRGKKIVRARFDMSMSSELGATRQPFLCVCPGFKLLTLDKNGRYICWRLHVKCPVYRSQLPDTVYVALEPCLMSYLIQFSWLQHFFAASSSFFLWNVITSAILLRFFFSSFLFSKCHLLEWIELNNEHTFCFNFLLRHSLSLSISFSLILSHSLSINIQFDNVD